MSAVDLSSNVEVTWSGSPSNTSSGEITHTEVLTEGECLPTEVTTTVTNNPSMLTNWVEQPPQVVVRSIIECTKPNVTRPTPTVVTNLVDHERTVVEHWAEGSSVVTSWPEAADSISLVVEDAPGSLKHRQEIVVNEDETYVPLPHQESEELTCCAICQQERKIEAGCNLYEMRTATSHTPLSDLLASLVLTEPSSSIHFTNSEVCKSCLFSLDRVDHLQQTLQHVQAELKDLTQDISSNLTIITATNQITEKVDENEMHGMKQQPTIQCRNNTPLTPPHCEIKRQQQFKSQQNLLQVTHNTRSGRPRREKSRRSKKDEINIDDWNEDNLKAEQKPLIQCPFCKDVVFHDKSQLADHFDGTHSSKSSVECQICFESIQGGIKNFLLHMAKIHPDTDVKPGSGFVKVDLPLVKNRKKSKAVGVKSSLIKNIKTEKDDKVKKGIEKYQVNCPICFKLLRKYSLKIHMMDMHNSGKKIKCRHCDEEFPKRTKYLKHLEVVHGTQLPQKKKKLECEQCNKFFTCNYTLNQHISNVHLDRRDHLCNVCGAKYKNRSALKVHLRKHSGAKPYSCQVCKKSFMQSDSAKRHVRKVHNIACDVRLNNPLNESPLPVQVDFSKM